MSDNTTLPNARQAEDWNEQVGRTWAMLHERLDRQIGPIGRAALATAALKRGERVLDVGCGCGETTFEIAAAAAPGEVTGLDVSGLLLGIARETAAAKGLNIRFIQGDAQVLDLPKAAFDVLFSRFGVMFFDDPRAAFANLRKALKRGGRLAFACWRSPAENLWLAMPMRAAGHLLPPLPPGDPNAPGPFAFADSERMRGILSDAGFADVEIEPLDLKIGSEPLEDSVFLALRMGPLGAALRQTGASDELKRKVEDALREGLRPHVEGGMVRLPAAAWIVSAGNP